MSRKKGRNVWDCIKLLPLPLVTVQFVIIDVVSYYMLLCTVRGLPIDHGGE